MAKIVIDAGHGGRDGGSYGKYSNESKLMLQIALKMKPILERSGHTVVLTRSTDTYLTLSQRASIANRANANIFVSLHNNSATASTAHGFETFIFNGKNVSANTVRLQNNVHDVLAKGLGLRDRGKKRANFGVLRESNMPAVLIEYAFISNANEEKFLNNNIDKMAQLTAEGINKYFGVSTAKPTPPKPTPTPKPQPVPVRANDLTKTQLDDVREALKQAFESGDFFTDHSKNVENMSRKQIEDLLLFNLFTRDYIKRKGGK